MLGIVFTMFFNGGIIPTYLLINNTLHLGNNLLALIVPGLVSSYNLIIMRTAFQGISESLLESARIDGAGRCAFCGGSWSLYPCRLLRS